nr:putative copia-like polyprotein [Tanacetum cinerariifolium]
MMKRIIKSTHGHPLKDQKILQMDKLAPCTSCSLRKLIARPSPLKVEMESPVFLERIQGDICGPIHPPCGPFRAHFSDYTVKHVKLDNAGEFTSQAFNDYCMSVGIIVEHLVAHSEPSLLYLDLHTKQSETEVQKIMHMQEFTNQLPDASIDTKRVTKSYIPAVNAPARVEIPDIKSDDKVTQESKACLKRGRPVGSKDKNHRKRKATENAIIHEDSILDGTQNVAPSEEKINDINKEISINYEPTSVIECQSRHDWNKWKEAMQAELDSLNKRNVFGRIILIPRVVKPIGRWIDYEETYSLVMDAITFRYLISLDVSEKLDMRRIDVVTAYLYGSLDSDIYIKIPEGFKMPEALSAKPKDMYSVKLQRSLYGLKQSGRMCMNTWLNIKKLDENIVQKHGGSKQVGLKQLGSKQVRFKQIGHKQVEFKQLGPDVETGVHGVQVDKRVWFEVKLQGAQRNREAKVFQVSNDDVAVAQRWLEVNQLKEKSNTDCLGAEGNVAEKKKVKEYMEANLGKLLKYNAWLTRWSPIRGSST